MSDENEPDSAEPAAEAEADLAEAPVADDGLSDEPAPELDATKETSEELEPEGEAGSAAFGIDAIEDMAQAAAAGRTSAFMGVPIEVLICVGKARPLVSDLVKLRRDSVISLDSRIDDPVEIYIGDRLIARGELQEMEDQEGQLGVRLTEVADLSNAV